MCVCVCACVRARACVRVCVCVREEGGEGAGVEAHNENIFMSITVNNCSGHNATAEDILILADTPSF